MARYIEREKFLKKCAEAWGYAGVTIKAIEHIADECTTAEVAPKSEVERLQIEIEALKIANEKMYSAIEETKSEVIEEYRQRVNTKMGKHTHLLGKEYVQRILREVAKEMKNEQG